ncbi:hypothetical protein MRX96_008739 [Rhipicephalus microplus]
MAVDWELLRSPDEVDQKDAYEHILQASITPLTLAVKLFGIARSVKVDPNDLDDPEDLRELFDAARQIMKMRIELAELASEKSTALHHRTQEEEEELGELRQKLASAEKQASQVPRLKEENRALGKQVSQLENELDELSNQLHRSQQETDRQLSAKLRDKNAHVAQLLADLQAASTKTGYDPSAMQWVDIEVAERREDLISGEDEYLQIMVCQLQKKLAKMKPRGSTAAAQPQARKTGSTPAAFGPGGIGTGVQRFAGSTTNAGICVWLVWDQNIVVVGADFCLLL